MNSAERRAAIAAGHRWADECPGGALIEITEVIYACMFAPPDDTLDDVLMGEWLQVANAAARERWAERGGR